MSVQNKSRSENGKSHKVSRSAVLCEELATLACELGPQAKFPTVTQLRSRWGGSLATLNMALSELESRHIIYRKHGVGIFVSPHLVSQKVWYHVGLICPPNLLSMGHSPFWDILVQRAEERAVAHGEDLSFHFALPESQSRHESAPFHSGLVHAIENGQLHGILAIQLKPNAMQWLENCGVPVVAHHQVKHDMNALVQMGVETLVARGCRQLALWSPVSPQQIRDSYHAEGARHFAIQYKEFFRAAVGRNQLPFHEEFTRQNLNLLEKGNSQVILEREQGYQTALEVLSQTPRPDGIVIIDDLMTPGVLAALEKLGLKIGKDIHIATRSNAQSPVLAGHENHLIRLEFDPKETVDALFHKLDTLMKGEKPLELMSSVLPHLRLPEDK